METKGADGGEGSDGANEDGVGAVEGAADVDDGLVRGWCATRLDLDGKARCIGVGDGGFNDGRDMAEIGWEDPLMQDAEAANSETSRSGNGKEFIVFGGKIAGSPGQVEGDGFFEGDGRREDNGFKRGNPGVAEVGGMAFDGVEGGNEDGCEVLFHVVGVGISNGHLGLEGELNYTSRSSQGAPEWGRRIWRERLSRQYNAVVTRQRSRNQGIRRWRRGRNGRARRRSRENCIS